MDKSNLEIGKHYMIVTKTDEYNIDCYEQAILVRAPNFQLFFAFYKGTYLAQSHNPLFPIGSFEKISLIEDPVFFYKN